MLTPQPKLPLLPVPLALLALFGASALLYSPPAAADAAPPTATAPSDPPVTLAPTPRPRFGAILQALAAQAHVTVIAEDVPLHQTLANVAQLTLPPNTPISQAMTLVAAAFDYDAQRNGSVFLLKKRFTDPSDLPNVTLEECTEALRDIGSDLDMFDPGPRESMPGPYCLPLMRLEPTLTPDQLSAMHETTAEKGLAIASLTPDQQAIIRKFVLSDYVDTYNDTVKGAGYMMAQTPTLTLRFDLDTAQGGGPSVPPQPGLKTASFGYVIRDSFDRPDFISLIRNRPLDAPPIPAPVLSQNAKVLPALQAPPAQAGDQGYTTLGAVVAGLNKRGQPASVAAALGAKAVTIYGADAAQPAEIMQALADIYGLHVETEHQAAGVILRLKRRPYTWPSELSGLPQAIRYAMPDPFLRVMHEEWMRKQVAKNANRPAPKSLAESLAREQEREKIWPLAMQMLILASTLKNNAAEALRVEMEDRLNKRGTSVKKELAKSPSTAPIALASLSPSARSAFALLLMTDVLDKLEHSLGDKVPVWVADLDNCYLTGGLGPSGYTPGKLFFTMFISAVGPDGRLLQYMGTGTELKP